MGGREHIDAALSEVGELPVMVMQAVIGDWVGNGSVSWFSCEVISCCVHQGAPLHRSNLFWVGEGMSSPFERGVFLLFALHLSLEKLHPEKLRVLLGTQT